MVDPAGTLTALGAVWLFLAHRVGDWLLQNHWMAIHKTHSSAVAALHGAVYALPFIPLCGSVWAWLVIAVSHAVIDRYRLPRHMAWARNQFAPRRYRYPYAQRHQNEGMAEEVPRWLSTHVRMETDATMHHLCNLAAVLVL